jgi:hypothetical protein
MAPLRPKFVAHKVVPSQKAMRVRDAQEMLTILGGDEIHDFSHIVTGDETMVPLRNDEDFQWAEIGTPRLLVPRVDYHPRQVMLSVYWSVGGFHVVDILPRKEHMDAAYFQAQILDPLSQELKPKKSPFPIWLHFDNARPHTAYSSAARLAKLGFQRMPHPPYSPDISPCDFYLFGTVKRKLKGLVAQDDNDVADMFYEKLMEISREERLSAMHDWVRRLHDVVESGGEICF